MFDDDDAGKALLAMLAASRMSSNKKGSRDKIKVPKREQAKFLKEALGMWEQRTVLKKGDLIVTKSDTFSPWVTTQKGGFLIVTEVLEKPRVNVEDDESNAYATLQYDIIAMTYSEEGFAPQHFYDSRYFKIYDEEQEEENSNVTKFRRP